MLCFGCSILIITDNQLEIQNFETANKSTLLKTGNSDLKRVQTNSAISSLLPGSSSPNWLHGNANISKPIKSSKNKNKKNRETKDKSLNYHKSQVQYITQKLEIYTQNTNLDLYTSRINDSIPCNLSWSFHFTIEKQNHGTDKNRVLAPNIYSRNNASGRTSKDCKIIKT